ncbi:hypothetical protein H0E87_025555 [Populus deltoides]|uniref:DUF4220 domain-containing protein n=1 Tax=Populus deltoides TaxID=3696 RepID=A0A8T2X3L6_POPDE|nr:hypothetical protein H0E87_025555 [Populus deltoides]KAH8486588.1 hypothetical protein H0E87_025555 [Populus deltoides]
MPSGNFSGCVGQKWRKTDALNSLIQIKQSRHLSFFKGSSREVVSTVEEKMTMLKKLPEQILDLWNNWEIRGMVLLSLLLQTILIVFASRRKTTASNWIILVWAAYLSADMVATVALGNLARSQGDSSCDSSEKANSFIQAFWAPFLLLHLGGPDTITAYSIEDNELWKRHLLGLVVRVGVAFYVFSRTWGSGILTLIAILMFIVGVEKYAERTWVLWSSCSKSLQNSSRSDFRFSYHRTRIPVNSQQDLQRDYLLQAYIFLDISKFMMQNFAPGIPSLIKSRELISKNKADGAFKVVEAELGLIYDMLYTKAPLIYSRAGITLRCISSLLSATAFLTFQVKIDKHAYSRIDITITYLLFAAAIFLEFYSFLCLVLSDWTMIWLIDKGGNALTSALYSLIRKLTTSKRWSRSISQYNLVSFAFESEPVNQKDLNVGLQGLIFENLRKKAQKIKEDFNVVDKNVRRKIIGQRGDGVLEREGLLLDYKWCTTEVEFSRSILVWHLATEFCCIVDKDGSNVSKEYKTSKCLSEYMMYLLLMRPNMLSKGFGNEGYLETLRDLRGLKYPRRGDHVEYQRNLRELLGLKDRGPDDEENQRTLRNRSESVFQGLWKTEKSVLRGVDVLASQLLQLESKKRWEMINEVWVEMLAYAAAHCPWKEHTHQLRRGGELLTHVSLLMLHLGLSAQYDINGLDSRVFFKGRDIFKLTGEYEEYIQGIAAMSRSSPYEEEVAIKEQELELLRSRLAASTPRKGNGELELELLRSRLAASTP